jgi:hypothetical protein
MKPWFSESRMPEALMYVNNQKRPFEFNSNSEYKQTPNLYPRQATTYLGDG